MNNNNCAPFLNKDYLTEEIYFQTRLHTKPFEIKKIESEEPATEKTLVIIGEGKHTFPSRTRSLSSQSPMVVRPRCRARVGSCQYYEARSLFGDRASPILGACVCLFAGELPLRGRRLPLVLMGFLDCFILTFLVSLPLDFIPSLFCSFHECLSFVA